MRSFFFLLPAIMHGKRDDNNGQELGVFQGAFFSVCCLSVKGLFSITMHGG